MNYQELTGKVRDQAVQFYFDSPDERLHFHNLAHKARVLDMANKMISHYNLDDRARFITLASIWILEPEKAGLGPASEKGAAVDRMVDRLASLGVGKEDLLEIRSCLAACEGIHVPESICEKICSDASSFYFGSNSFSQSNKLRRKEAEAFAGHKISGILWREQSITLFENHQFYTEYAQSLLNLAKQNNLRTLLEKQASDDQKNYPEYWGKNTKREEVQDAQTGIKPKPPGEPSSRLSGKKPKHHLRGVETMFRNSSSNHLRLSVMADNKAFIMISVNSILISVAIGLIIGKLVLIPKLFVPTVFLLLVNVVAIIYSVLATRPGVMKGTFTKKEVEDKTVDLLFFGSFYKMPLEDFEYGIRVMMDDIEFLYGSLIKDIYLQGKVLGRKFRFLRISYNIFMYGTAATVLAYILTFIF
jgi:hypothetical protein